MSIKDRNIEEHEGHDLTMTDSGLWCDDCDERLHCGVLI